MAILQTFARISSVLLSVVLLTGCGGMMIRNEFRGYHGAYADMLNEQMLTNLARLQNGHPAHFLAVGTIQSRVNVNAEATAGGSVTDTDTVTRNSEHNRNALGVLGLATRTLNSVGNVVLGGTAGGRIGGGSNPEFTFIPLNSEEATKQVLQPIHTEVFYTLYQQGWPIDQLLRVMVERIETVLPDGDELVLVNSPTRSEPKSFFLFLQTCEILRKMQRGGALVLTTRREFVPLAEGAHGAENEPLAESPDTRLDPAKKVRIPSSEQLMKADEKGMAWREVNGRWQLGRYVEMPTFQLRNQDSARIAGQMSKGRDAKYQAAVRDVVHILSEGISVKSNSTDGATARSRLILRSYNRALDGVASEQNRFDRSLREYASQLPSGEAQPILRLNWAKYTGKLARSTARVRYEGDTYEVTDPVDVPQNVSETWNRDVFRLLVALSSQVTVDISKFQRQVLEVR